jgi:hypothetical protein
MREAQPEPYITELAELRTEGVISVFESFGGNARSSCAYFTDPLLINAPSISLECDMNYVMSSVIYKLILDPRIL